MFVSNIEALCVCERVHKCVSLSPGGISGEETVAETVVHHRESISDN